MDYILETKYDWFYIRRRGYAPNVNKVLQTYLMILSNLRKLSIVNLLNTHGKLLVQFVYDIVKFFFIGIYHV